MKSFFDGPLHRIDADGYLRRVDNGFIVGRVEPANGVEQMGAKEPTPPPPRQVSTGPRPTSPAPPGQRIDSADVSRQLTEAGQSPAVQLVMLQNNCESLRDTIEQMRTELTSVPQWHLRPTGPGLWICWGDENGGYQGFTAVVLRLDDDALNRGAPFASRCVYGPLPEPPLARETP